MKTSVKQRGATWLHARRRPPRPFSTAVGLAMTLMSGVLGSHMSEAGAAPTGQAPGIDISSYQHPADKPINWKAVRSSGMQFVYIKATEPAGSGKSYNNPWFKRDWVGSGQAGLYRGAYHFAQPRLPLGTAEQDAQQFLNLTGPMNGPLDMPPVLDLEATGGLSAINMTAWTARWLSYVKAVTGKKPIIYSGWAFWKTALDDTKQFNGHQLWMARWQTKGPSPLPGGWQQWKIWQYGTTTVRGISGAVDGNVMCGVVPTYGAPAGCPGIPEKPKATTTSSSNGVTINAKTIASKQSVVTATGSSGRTPIYYTTYTYKSVRYRTPVYATASISPTKKYTARKG